MGPAFSSWSGGKDSALALHKAGQAGTVVTTLLTMMAAEPEAHGRSRSHGLTEDVLRRQSESLGLAHEFRSAAWADYEAVFRAALLEFREAGLAGGVFGDIDLAPHREWVERVCREAGLEPAEPLWGLDRRKVIWEILAAGFQAVIVSCDQKKMGEKYLGREITPGLVRELERIGVDPAGENGEYHTFVFDGPLFAQPVAFRTGAIEENNGYLFLSLE